MMIRIFLVAAFALASLCARAERAMQFTGTGVVQLPALNQLKFGATGDFALELWVKPANPGTELGAIFTSADYNNIVAPTGTNGAWGLYWQGGFRAVMHPSRTPSTEVVPGGFQTDLVGATTSVWHHVVANFRRSQSMTFYVDGVLKSTIDNAASWAALQRTLDSTNAYRLGADPSGGSNFKGLMDEVRIWGRPRTAEEILNAFKNKTALSGTEPGLIAYYQFNEGAANATSAGTLGDLGIALVLGANRTEDPSLVLANPPPPATDFGLSFNGVNQSIETQIAGDKLAGNELSIEYWFKGANPLSAVRLQSATNWIVTAWSTPPQHFFNFNGKDLQLGVNTAGKDVRDGFWHHVAVTWRAGSTNGMIAYLDGQPGGLGLATAPGPIPNIPARLWIGSLNGTSEFLKGSLDEVRIWNRVLPPDEIKEHATSPQRLLGGDPGLVAYFPFNDSDPSGTVDLVSKQLASFRNMGAAERFVQDLNIVDAKLRTVPNPVSAGLWVGQIQLKNVLEVGGTSTNTSPAGGTFDFNVLLHADTAGAVRLLKDVTIMQLRNTATNLSDLVLVTDDTLLPNFEGVIKRAGKLVGLRYSSAFYQFDGQSLPLTGGIGYGFKVTGTNATPASLPTNPFRHKFHPQHKNPADLQGASYDITREIEITMLGGGKTGVSDGRDRLTGFYREVIRGLHKAPLVVDGEITLERVSLVSKLNNK